MVYIYFVYYIRKGYRFEFFFVFFSLLKFLWFFWFFRMKEYLLCHLMAFYENEKRTIGFSKRWFWIIAAVNGMWNSKGM